MDFTNKKLIIQSNGWSNVVCHPLQLHVVTQEETKPIVWRELLFVFQGVLGCLIASLWSTLLAFSFTAAIHRLDISFRADRPQNMRVLHMFPQRLFFFPLHET